MRELTPQERQVVKLISRGLTLDEIARQTSLTYSQVKIVTRDLRKELDVARTRDIPYILRELGVIE